VAVAGAVAVAVRRMVWCFMWGSLSCKKLMLIDGGKAVGLLA
jgi:hypothetical protein